MNFQHLTALLKLRFQLSRNQLRKSGKLNSILLTIAGALFWFASTCMFFVALILGLMFLPKAEPVHHLLIWNLIAGSFVFVWLIYMVVEIQQTELLSLDKLLHLPISLKNAFLLNYSSSFFNSTILMFVPSLAGLAIALVIVGWPNMLVAPILIAAFLFFMTSLTYLFRDWLGRIMENKRHRGTVIAIVTLVFVGIMQLPYMFTMQLDDAKDKGKRQVRQITSARMDQLVKQLDQKIDDEEITAEEKESQLAELSQKLDEENKLRKAANKKQTNELLTKTAETVDAAVPPGWVPLGIYRAAQGNFLPAIYGTLAFTFIGLVSLTLAYRSTVRKYTGGDTKGRLGSTRHRLNESPSSATDFQTKTDEQVSAKRNLISTMFDRLPLLTEQQSAVAIVNFRTALRAPETKMALLLPLVLGIIYGAVVMSKSDFSLSEQWRPMIPAIIFFGVLFCVSQLFVNQFGSDRDGFRAFVLSPVSRRDILIGKNAGAGILIGLVCLLLLLIFQFANPLKLTHFLAALVQLPITIMLYCLLGNAMSIFVPYGIKRSTMQPSNLNLLSWVLLFVAIFAMPFLHAPMMGLIGAEMMLEQVFEYSFEPLYLVGSLIELGLVIAFYFWFVRIQGNWLHYKETNVLDRVSNLAE